MFRWPRSEVLGISRRDFSLVFTLLFNALTWSYMAIMLIQSIRVDPVIRTTFSTVFYISASGASLAGALLSQKIQRSRFLSLWMILGLISSFPFLFINSITLGHISISLIVLGISFGLGMPSSLAHLADKSSIENRARVSSLILLVANLTTLPIGILFANSDLTMNAIILLTWRGLGFAAFLLLKPKEESYSDKQKCVSFASVLRDRSFFLYFLPWVMFCLIDILEKSLLLNVISSNLQRSMLTVEPLVAVFFMFVAGALADRIGRKKVVIYGFISLGTGYAMVGLAPFMNEAWYFYFVVDGIAWSIFYTIFLLTLGGDLSQSGTREKYYAVASLPYVATSAIPLVFEPLVASVSATAAFSLASFFLFLAVLPLMYAPETLPEKKIELRRLKNYVERAKKVRDKYLQKSSDIRG